VCHDKSQGVEGHEDTLTLLVLLRQETQQGRETAKQVKMSEEMLASFVSVVAFFWNCYNYSGDVEVESWRWVAPFVFVLFLTADTGTGSHSHREDSRFKILESQ
tara:strand:+ start:224 stop:535 length:312 start_codon:yes stop_codon:yes gene_type:complete